MSMYIENNLSKDEGIVIKAKKNPLYLLFPIIWVAIFLIVASVLTGIYGATPTFSYNEAACIAVVNKELDEEYDKASKEEQKWMLEAEGVKSRSALKKKMIDESTKGIKEAEKVMPQVVKAMVEEMMKEAEVTKGDVILVMVMPFVAIVCWIGFAISALVLIKKGCRFGTSDLALTNKRIIGKTGLLHARITDIHIDKVDNVQIKQTIFGNLMKYYGIEVKAASNDAANKTNEFVGVKNAQEFKDKTNEVIEQHAELSRKAQAEEIARAMKG